MADDRLVTPNSALHLFPRGWPVTRLLAILRQHRTELTERYKVKTLGVFGSYVYNRQRQGSDLDVLVEFDDPPSLFKLIELEDYLGDLLGVKVDLVMRDTLKPRIGRRVLSEVVLI
jgi:predicted nucleotidyltransferase